MENEKMNEVVSESISTNKLYADVIKYQESMTKKIFIIMCLFIALFLASLLVNFFVIKELLSYQTDIVTETNEYMIDGENNSFRQYNDNAVHNQPLGAETTATEIGGE